jgi:hypothetical protein
MKTTYLTLGLLGLALVTAAAAPPPKDWRKLLPTVSGNLAITKERAERGDAKSQVELADIFSEHRLSAQAIEWYRKAAEQGSLRAKYRLGELLLFGVNDGGEAQERVMPNPAEGIRWTFEAATNYHSEACHNMARALEAGLGVAPNLVESYAWLEVYARSNSSNAKVEMDRLALRMNLTDIREAHTVAVVFMKGRWPELATRKTVVSTVDPGIKLNGITVGPVSMAIINGRTFEQGDSGEIKAKDGPTVINCVKIAPNSVEIAIQGESETRTLTLR